MKHEVVIIGGGLGGLLCGYILCKHGYDVVVLEKNPILGGCLQTFRRNGFLFDTGMHYIGSIEEGQSLHRFWKYFSLLDTIPLKKLDENAFDVISYQGKRYPSAMGYERYMDTLSAFFPKQKTALKNYVDILHKVTTSSPISRLEEVTHLTPLEPEYVKTSVNEYLSRLTPDPVLQNVLAGNSPLYAGVKGKTPFYIHAFIHNSYIQSAYRIVGGGQSIADSLTASIRSMGGQVLPKSEVVKLEGTEQQVRAVYLQDGRRIEGRHFISAIHPQALIRMLDESMVKRSYCRRVRNMKNTMGCVTLYLGFKQNTVPYYNSNFFHFSTPDVWQCAEYTEGSWPLGYLFMHQVPRDGGMYSDSALLISYMRYEEVLCWKDTPVGRRGEAYEAFKEAKALQLIETLNQEFPGIKDQIAYYNVSTPLTYEDYTGTSQGAMYGILQDVGSSVQTVVSQRSYIPNLYMTGQNTNSHGMLGVTNGAMLTCAELLGINTVIKAINAI